MNTLLSARGLNAWYGAAQILFDVDLRVERGIAVLFTEHSMDVVFAQADRIIVLARGRLIAEGTPAAIRDHPKVQEVYFGSGRTFEVVAA